MLQFKQEDISINVNGEEYVGNVSEIENIGQYLIDFGQKFDANGTVEDFQETAREFIDDIFEDGTFDTIFAEYTPTFMRILQLIDYVMDEVKKHIDEENALMDKLKNKRGPNRKERRVKR